MAPEYRRKTTSVSLINYHFVWGHKYQREVLDGPAKERWGALVREAPAELDCEVPAGGDHTRSGACGYRRLLRTANLLIVEGMVQRQDYVVSLLARRAATLPRHSSRPLLISSS